MKLRFSHTFGVIHVSDGTVELVGAGGTSVGTVRTSNKGLKQMRKKCDGHMAYLTGLLFGFRRGQEISAIWRMWRSLAMAMLIMILVCVCHVEARERSREEVLEAIMSGPRHGAVSQSDQEWDDLIIQTVKRYGFSGPFAVLLDKGRGPNARDRKGVSAIRWAAVLWLEGLVEWLLKHGANLGLEEGGALEEQLIRSAISGDSEKVSELIGKGARIDAKADAGETALHWACIMGSYKVTELLLIRGANADVRNFQGWTPLIMAVIRAHDNIVKLLLAHGVDIKAKDSLGMDALAWAEASNLPSAAYLIETADADAKNAWQASKRVLLSRETVSLTSGRDEIPVREGKLKWVFDAGKGYVTAPTIAGGRAYFTVSEESKGRVVSVSTSTGKEKWTLGVEGGVTFAPSIVDGVAYFCNRNYHASQYHLYAVDIGSGREKWKFKTDGDVAFAPAVIDGVAYLGAFDGHIYAVDVATGRQKWKVRAADWTADRKHYHVSPITVSDGVAYFGTGDAWSDEVGYVYATDVKTGTAKWRFRTWKQAHRPVVYDGVVFAGANDACLYAVEAASGEEKWRFSSKRERPEVFSALIAAVVDGVAYLKTTNGKPGAYTPDAHIFAVDVNSGLRKWKFTTDAEYISIGTITDGTLYASGSDGHIYVLDIAKGALKCKIKYGGRYATIADEVAYWGTDDGKLYAMDIKNLDDEKGAIDSFIPSASVKPSDVFREPEGSPKQPEAGGGTKPVKFCESEAAGEEKTYKAARKPNVTPIVTQESHASSSEPRIEEQRLPGFKHPRNVVLRQGSDEQPNLEWKVMVGGFHQGHTLIKAAGLICFFQGTNLIALDPKNGRQRWRLKNGPGAYGVPIHDGGLIYFRNPVGELCAVDAKTGEEKWRSKLEISRDRLAISDGVVCFADSWGDMVAFDLQTRKIRWRFKATNAQIAEIFKGTVFFGDNDNFYAVDVRTGQEKWKRTGFLNYPGPVAADDVVCNRGAYTMHGIDVNTGKVLWKFTAGEDCCFIQPTVISEGLVCFEHRKNLHALDLKTGEEKWRKQLGAWVKAVAVEQGMLYCGTDVGSLHALSLRTGEEKWHFKMESSVAPLAVFDGILFLGTGGYLYAMDLGNLR